MQLEQIIELVPGMVYRVELLPDGQRRATYVSGGSRALFGVEPEAILADGMLLHRLRHPEDRDRISAETGRANALRLTLDTEYRTVLPNGELKWLQLLSAPVPHDDGPPARVGLVLDITAAKQAVTLRSERDHAAAADRAKSEFLSRVSHELRTPLNAVLGFAQLMQMDPGHGEFGARQLAWTRQVLASGYHLLALVNDVLDLSSVQTGRLSLHLEALDLAPVVLEARVLLQSEAEASEVQLELIAPPGPVPAVLADRKRLLQVLCNLLSNAIKFNRRGGWVRVQWQPCTGAAGADEVELAIADSGPGLEAAQVARLFQPFERAGAERGAVGGTGLGLALSRQLVEGMGGTVSVDSQPGQGAVFRVRLRAARPETPAQA
jgi:PAS domain S-box-containing protein